MAYTKKRTVDVAFDIETVTLPVTDKDIEEALRDYKPPKNIKDPIKLLHHKENYAENIAVELAEERAFTIDGKRCISVGLGYIDYNLGDVTHIECYASDDTSIIASGVAGYLNQFKDCQLRMVGWNSSNFDMPELLKVMFVGGRPKMFNKISKWDNVDLCYKPFPRMKLKRTAKAFGLPLMEGEMDGSSVAGLYENGDWETIIKYNKHDVWLTGMLAIAASAMVEL